MLEVWLTTTVVFFMCPDDVSECIQKFGADLGEEVWGAVNAIFDVLPLAAIVDNKVNP